MKKFHFQLMEKSSKKFCNISENVHCGRMITDEYAGEIICSKCGVVLQEKTWSYIEEPAKNDHYSESSSQMMTANTNYVGSSTTIGNAKSFGIRDHAGKTIPKTMQDSLNRLYNSGNIQRTSAKRSQGITTGVVKLDGLIHKLHLSENVCKETVALYKKAHAARIVSGRSIIGVVSACLYYSCKVLGIPRSMTEICDAANIKKNVLFSCYRKMVDSMGLYCYEKDWDDDSNNNNCNDKRRHHAKDNYDYDNSIAKQRHTRCIPKIISKLGLPQRISRQAASLILLQDDCSLSGRNPNAVAATAIYLTCNNDRKHNGISQREISDASGITEMSIRNISKKIRMMIKEEEEK